MLCLRAARLRTSGLLPSNTVRNVYKTHTALKRPTATPFRSFHASSAREFRGSQLLKVRSYYGSQSRPPNGPSGWLNRLRSTLNSIPGKTLVYGIIAVDVVIFVVFQTSMGSASMGHREVWDWLSRNMMSSMKNLKEGRVWTLVTSAFAHKNMEHLLFNMLGLWMFCPSVATSIGSAAFLGVYLAGAIGCDIFSLWWNRNGDPRRSSLGASGALCSIMSFTACLSPRSTVLLYGIIPMPLWGCVVGIFLYDLYGSQRRTTATTDFAGHIGGTLTGVGMYFLRNRLGIRGLY